MFALQKIRKISLPISACFSLLTKSKVYRYGVSQGLFKLWVATPFGVYRCNFVAAKQIQNKLAEYTKVKSFCHLHKKIDSELVVKLFRVTFLGVTPYFTLLGVHCNVWLNY